jgi:putative tryptophan/tyrosine transport system substrate-binding protein
MDKRWKVVKFLGIIALMLLPLIVTQLFNPPPPKFKVGILTLNKSRNEKVHGLKDSLQKLGYFEDKNIIYEVLDAQDDSTKVTELAEQLLKGNPDILIATGTFDVKKLKEVSSNIPNPPPIVFLGILSPVELGLVEDFSHPGTNITGLANSHVELTPKRLELLHKLLPNIKSVGLLEDPRTVPYDQAKANLQNTAKTLGLSINTYQISRIEEIAPVINDLVADGNEAILALSGFFIETSMPEIVEHGLQEGIPVFGIYPSDAELGCLASYGTSFYDQGSQSAYLVQKVLRGLPPSEIPIETPDKLNFIINLEVAKKLNLALDPALLSFADEVIRP